MNRIEQACLNLRKNREKVLTAFLTAGYPDLERTKELLAALQEAGAGFAEIGIPFSDPVAGGPAIQDASYRAALSGINLQKTARMLREARSGGIEIPVIFHIYYNQILHCGLADFARVCKIAGADGLIVPDLPVEEQEGLQEALRLADGPLLLQAVSGSSEQRMRAVLSAARGFVFCACSGETEKRSDEGEFLRKARSMTKIPVLVDPGADSPNQVLDLVREGADGVIAREHFAKFLANENYAAGAARRYCEEWASRLRKL